ncbi:MAG: type 4b pilus protein PilO2 [Alphaproteobacteria bacterium]|nr:type 4b pilus protein PilO2 [Alphaproteobacteria bacterium]
MFWQPLPSGRQQLHFIERTARSIIGGGQFYCTKSGGAAQFGLGFSKRGHRSGQIVATLSIAQALKDKTSTLAIFKVPQGWWMVVIRNNLILPEDDFLFEKEEEAKKAFQDLFSLPDWGYKIAPATWGIEGTQEILVGKLLDRVKGVPLQSIAGGSGKYLLFAALILGIGFYFTKDIFFPKPLPVPKQNISKKFQPKKIGNPKKQSESKTDLKPAVTKAEKKVQNDGGWHGLPDFVEQATLCEKGLSYLAYPIPGWQFTELNCKDNELKGKYIRRDGSLDFFKTAHKEYFSDAKMVVENNGETVFVSMDLPKAQTRDIPPILPKEDIEARLRTFSQKTKQVISLQETSDQPPTTINFRVVNFTFSSKIPLREWATLLNAFQSVRWYEMSWTLQNKSWTGKGVIYAN